MSERSELDKAVKFWGAEDYCNGIKALVTAGKEKLATMEPDEYLPQKGAIVEMSYDGLKWVPQSYKEMYKNTYIGEAKQCGSLMRLVPGISYDFNGEESPVDGDTVMWVKVSDGLTVCRKAGNISWPNVDKFIIVPDGW